jgi:hypothetical protein
MTKAKKLIQLIEAVKITKLSKAIDGLTFINRKKIKVPAGTYTDLGPEGDYRVLSDDENNILYLVKME